MTQLQAIQLLKDLLEYHNNNRRAIQTGLTNLRDTGYDCGCKLNAKTSELLEAAQMLLSRLAQALTSSEDAIYEEVKGGNSYDSTAATNPEEEQEECLPEPGSLDARVQKVQALAQTKGFEVEADWENFRFVVKREGKMVVTAVLLSHLTRWLREQSDAPMQPAAPMQPQPLQVKRARQLLVGDRVIHAESVWEVRHVQQSGVANLIHGRSNLYAAVIGLELRCGDRIKHLSPYSEADFRVA